MTDNGKRPPTARVIEVIEVVFLRGEGIYGDPIRRVTGYYSPDGILLAESDPEFDATPSIEVPV